MVNFNSHLKTHQEKRQRISIVLLLVELLLAEPDSSSLSCVCMYLDLPGLYVCPNAPSSTIGPSEFTNQ